ncbi:anionic antimicrobial peptide 2 [Helicoverpa armigera]|uniref:anionic antimicrobial peptide 2 n=1 Tax=Helicoverpa armigera TaxID=29058 RepID=UPI000B3A8F42|nr:anionic antimicrobial peptide 2-like [Helicoverpa armigera]
MNKTLIVLVAVCLVSAHAFVKRDAPAAAPADANYLENIQKKFQDFTKDFNSQITNTFNPEAMKKQLNSIAESVNKAMSEMKGQPAAA